MKRNLRVRWLALGLFALATPALASAQEKAPPPPAAVNVTVTAAGPPAPAASITLHDRHGHVTPVRGKCSHTGGGLIDVASPAPDTVVITMSGAVLANSSMHFDLEQCFEIGFDDPKLKKAKLTVEGRVVGLLRGEPKGCAEFGDACAYVGAGPAEVVGVCVPPHSVCGKCESLAVNDHDGPKLVPVQPGTFTLRQTFTIAARTDSLLCKRPSAEFAPDPALDPLWISYFDPFHGVKKDSFGFQVILHVVPDTGDGKNGGEPPPQPMEKKDGTPTKPPTDKSPKMGGI